MEISTLTKLQQLKDAEFHSLCDELIPRVFSRCFPVTPYGRNSQGDSVRGQPDSYVGDTAKHCRIAIQYTVQSKSWWTKLISDVKEARAACPSATEIVVSLPRDVDRERPKRFPGSNWLDDARNAAAPATLTVLSGRKICQELDSNSQDLRWEYLKIRCSRTNFRSLATSCHEATAIAIERLESLDRYRPDFYVSRDDDRLLFGMWQECLRNVMSSSGRDRRNFIPIVADSGLGKTSLLAHFAKSRSDHAPILLLLARDLWLENEGSLVKTVMDRIQGAIHSEARLEEEAAVASVLKGKAPLTVVVDGLDETGNADALRKVMSSWITSKLGSSSVLITSSRKEFWRTCRDGSWRTSIYFDGEPEHASKPLRIEESITSNDSLRGVEIPHHFESAELVKAWCKSGRDEKDFWVLPAEVRESLRQPFAAYSAMELLSAGEPPSSLTSKTVITCLWLERRLVSETDDATRISTEHFKTALRLIAGESQLSDGGWVKVDQLSSVPRFDPARPPGQIVERLIGCALLETRPKHADQIRFTSEAIQDFYRSQLVLEKIAASPFDTAVEFGEMSFSSSVTILEALAEHLVDTSIGDEFIEELAKIDAIKAAVCIRPGLETYSAKLRHIVATALGQIQDSRLEVDRALAIDLLGRMSCTECKQELTSYWTKTDCPPRLRSVLAHAAISLGISELVDDVFKARWFRRESYFVGLGSELLATTTDFKNALKNLCSLHLDQPATDEYRTAISVLGYLSDFQAVDSIEQYTQDRLPYYFESLYLLRLGEGRALDLFKKIVSRYLHEKGNAEVVNDEYGRWSRVFPFPNKIGKQPSDELVNYAISLLRSKDTNEQRAGCSLAGILYDPDVLAEMTAQGFHYPNYRTVGWVIGPERWLQLWENVTSVQARQALLAISSDIRDPRVEDEVILALRDSELVNYAAHALGPMGSIRSCSHLRELLSSCRFDTSEESWKVGSIAQSLISMRDEASIGLLVEHFRSSNAHAYLEFMGASRIAMIRTETAEKAILELDCVSDESKVAALVCNGSSRCVKAAISLAMAPDRGADWLVNRAKYAFIATMSSSNHFRSDVDCEQLLDFVMSNDSFDESELYDGLLYYLDGPKIRDLYGKLLSLRGTDDDRLVNGSKDKRLSDIAKRELVRRGDSRVLREYLNEEIDEGTKYKFSNIVVDRLKPFPKADVLATLRELASKETDVLRKVVIFEILGRLGKPSDVIVLNRVAASATDALVADAAYEASLRISDPLRIPQYY